VWGKISPRWGEGGEGGNIKNPTPQRTPRNGFLIGIEKTWEEQKNLSTTGMRMYYRRVWSFGGAISTPDS